MPVTTKDGREVWYKEYVPADRVTSVVQNSLWQKTREAAFLLALHGQPGFPELVGVDSTRLYMTHCGGRLYKGLIEQIGINQIHSALDEMLCKLACAHIKHRDITRYNVVWGNGVLTLVDFGWSIWDWEDDTPELPPHVMRAGLAVPDREKVWQLVRELENQL